MRDIYIARLIIDTLSRQPKSQTRDIDLFKEIKKIEPNVTWSEFNKALMILEIQSYIHVIPMSKNIRYIELITR